MFKLMKRWWKYTTAKLTGSFNERADPKVQLEQAIAEAQDQHRRLKEQAASLATDSFRLRPDVRVGLYQVNWLMRSGQVEVARNTLRELLSNYGEEITASAELTARFQFLENRLQVLSN